MKSNNISKFIVGLIISSIAFSAKDNQIHSMENSCNVSAENGFTSLIDDHDKKYEDQRVNRLVATIEEIEQEIKNGSQSSISLHSTKSEKKSVKEMENLLTTTITGKTEKRRNDEKIYCIEDQDIDINTKTWDEYTNGMIDNYEDNLYSGKDKNFVTEMEEDLAQKEERCDDSYIKNTEIKKNKIDDMINGLHLNDDDLMDILDVVNVVIDGYCINNIQDINYEGLYEDLKYTMTKENLKEQTRTNRKYICKPTYYLSETSYQETEPYVKKLLTELEENNDVDLFHWKIREQLRNKLKTLINKKREINPFWWEKSHGKDVTNKLYCTPL